MRLIGIIDLEKRILMILVDKVWVFVFRFDLCV